MLSGETANGKYPLEALKMMVKIAETTEQDYLRSMQIMLSFIQREEYQVLLLMQLYRQQRI